ncbi:hypothetical protein [Archangium violaceum]|uniref:hypothetical protein n=1 Tax=Archangium violaceum TaxID=83451 RepID=UPI0036DD5831
MLAWLKALFLRKRGVSAATEDSSAHRIAGPKDESMFLEGHPCECGGAWEPGAQTTITTERGRWRYTRAVQCSVCGTQSHFTFEAPLPEEEEGGQQAENPPREQHYIFVHKLLPRWFFEEPEDFIHSITQQSGISRLREIWEKVGADVASRDGENIPGDELTVEVAEVNGRKAALLRFPQPTAYTEAYFVCLVAAEPPEEARFYVLERTDVPSTFDPSEGTDVAMHWAVLCEWLEGGRRRNHQTEFIPSAEQLLTEVRRQLQEEARRRKAAAAAVMVPTWDIAGGEEYFDAVMSNEPFRLHPCLFAFHLLPEAAFDVSGSLPVNVGVEGASHVIGELWQRAAHACESLGHSALSPAQSPSVELLEVDDASYFLVRMPEALSPPEPFLVAIPRASDLRRIFLLEYAGFQKQALLASISAEGDHAIHGMSSGVDDSALMSAVSALNEHQQLKSTDSVLTHLMHYAKIAKAAQQVVPEAGS